MKAMKFVCSILAALAVCAILGTSAMAFTVNGGAVTVGAGDVVENQSMTDAWGHSWTGYDYRFSFSPNEKAYAQNGGSASLAGWDNAVYAKDNAQWFDEGGGTYYVCRVALDDWSTGTFTYKFDLAGTSRTIDSLIVSNCSSTSSGWVRWAVSTDGSNWSNYAEIHTGQGSADYYDLTSYVAGSSTYYIKGALSPETWFMQSQAFRTGGYGDWNAFDNRVWLSAPVPEPGSFVALFTGLVGLGGLVLRKRK